MLHSKNVEMNTEVLLKFFILIFFPDSLIETEISKLFFPVSPHSGLCGFGKILID